MTELKLLRRSALLLVGFTLGAITVIALAMRKLVDEYAQAELDDWDDGDDEWATDMAILNAVLADDDDLDWDRRFPQDDA